MADDRCCIHQPKFEPNILFHRGCNVVSFNKSSSTLSAAIFNVFRFIKIDHDPNEDAHNAPPDVNSFWVWTIDDDLYYRRLVRNKFHS